MTVFLRCLHPCTLVSVCAVKGSLPSVSWTQMVISLVRDVHLSTLVGRVPLVLLDMKATL